MFKSGIAILLFLLSLTLIILGSIVMGSADKTDETSKNNTKRSGTGVLIIGIIFLLATIIPIFHLFKGISYSSPSGAFFYF